MIFMKKLVLIVCLFSLFYCLTAQTTSLQYQFKGVGDEFADEFATDIITDMIAQSKLQVVEIVEYVLTYEQKTLKMTYSAKAYNVSGEVQQANADLYSDLDGFVRKTVAKSLNELEAAANKQLQSAPTTTSAPVASQSIPKTSDRDKPSSNESETTANPKVQESPTHSQNTLQPIDRENRFSKDMTYDEFKLAVRKEKGGFLEPGSNAYLKYKKYNTLKWCGIASLATGSAFLIPIGVPLLFVGLPGVIVMPLGGGLMLAGAIMLGCMGSQLQKSYDYYTQGQKRSLSINWHPAIGKDYAGFGMTMKF